ncbi:purine-cytosine permease family protein [Pragia fontium]|uniref:Nucleobase:cation symporter-1, NCS1 family n=2 Tax=Pragia fontium TaxID=82985 RepID=A0AAJ4W802_9GAMM|nr:cytosine permease [Pragia fontium]GKX62794.1 transporter [Pragia fontium]SFC07919.1 nucleobase:cation symporter-1, NCS1 family [Pragia fontium DSM 5563 = ATCC 49100]SUB81476.1 cytosine permease [Pragia fontium]VEJ53791.1 cytosine permease [Pragia fontium]
MAIVENSQQETILPSQGAPLIESRSIDYIPEAERHGSLFSQFTLWFGANLQITAIVTGALAVVLGGDVFWSLIGLLIGQILGGCVMALHAVQGPKLGLPQMISSRVQFGVYGAVLPIILVCIMYVGFSAGGTVLAGQAIAQLVNVSNWFGVLIFGAVIIGITICGYRVIHILGKVASVVGIVVFFYLFFKILYGYDIQALLSNRHFTLANFLLAMSLSASWQIAFGPYVADYSRYLPSKTSTVKAFLAVGLGTVIGTQASMVLGVFAAALAGDRFSGHEVTYIVSLGSTGLIAGLLYFGIFFGKVTITALNAYGSFMSLATIVSGFRGKPSVSPKLRLFFIIMMVGFSTLLALLGQHSFLKIFTAFLLFLLAFFTPWSAINLVDYYLVTKGRYDLPALSDPNGRYGRWNMPGIITYLLGLLIQLPFIATSFYTGALVDDLGGTDISWIVGLVVTGVIYYFVTKIWPPSVAPALILPDNR